MLWLVIFAFGLTLGGISVLFFTIAIKYMQLNVAYSVFSGACIFLIAILAHIIFGEKMNIVTMVGVVVTVVGIVLMSN
jgi:small multidrug resistance pump